MSVYDENLLAWDSLPDAQQTAYAWDALKEPPVYSMLADANNLWVSIPKVRKSTSWKESVQKFCWNSLRNITELQTALYCLEHDLEGAYRPGKGFEFMLNERGRMRPICGQTVEDRVVSHTLNDLILIPAIFPHLIYDNTASLKGRGVDMARRRLRAMLQRYYQREHTNIGYIRLKDQSKYYDNIRHDVIADQIRIFTDDVLANRVVKLLLLNSRLDISYMSDEAFARSMDVKFDRVEYRSHDYLKTGEKWLEKGMNVGDQFSQTAGILYPYRIDNLAKSVLGSKYYARYMDDSHDIDKDIMKLRERGEIIDREASAIGMYTNERKTCIARLDKGFVYLQHKLRLTDDGRVIERLKPKAVTRMRRKLKKLKQHVDSGRIPLKEVLDMYRSWEIARRDFLSYPQLHSLERLVEEIYGRDAYDYIYDRDSSWLGTHRPAA